MGNGQLAQNTQAIQELVEATTNNTESVLFASGVITASVIVGLFLYSLFKSIG